MAASRCRPTRVEVDLDACVHNVRAIRERVRPRDVWPVVKADAYGHGAVRVAQALAREKIAGLCVATATEGRELRQNGIAVPILVMTGLPAGGSDNPFEAVVEYGLTAAVPDAATAEQLAETARRMRIGPAAVHLKVDTGMGRIGVSVDQVVAIARAMRADPALSFDGLFSNLATAEHVSRQEPGSEFVAAQAEQFEAVCHALESEANLPAVRTLANSAAAEHHAATWEGRAYTGVRPGLAIYGASLTSESSRWSLRPAMRLVTQIAAVRRLPEGASVGYGVDTVLARPSRIAVLPLGYHDGLPRGLSGDARVFVRGRRVPLLGRISMDLTLADVTDVSAAAIGDEVVVFGASPGAPQELGPRESQYAATLAEAVGGSDADRDTASAPGSQRTAPSVEEVACWAATIPHEVLCRIGPRVPRIYRDSAASVGGSS